MNTSDIDLVYCWCDNADPVWSEKRRKTAERLGIALVGDENGDCRCVDNDDLLHSLRSACLYAPWLRRIYIVMDDDARPPSWLKDGERLRIVRHSEFIPKEKLPSFNSYSIEHFLFAIPGLSNRFLYANDDMMFNRPVLPDFFFAGDGCPVCRYGRSHADKDLRCPRTPYLTAVARAEDLLLNRFGLHGEFAKAYRMAPHHNIDAYLRSDYESCHEVFREEVGSAASFPFRRNGDIERTLYMGYALCKGHGHFRRARFRAILNRPWYKRLLRPGYADSLEFLGRKWMAAEPLLCRFNPALFCFNDSTRSTLEDRLWLRDFYARRFPAKSCFEN